MNSYVSSWPKWESHLSSSRQHVKRAEAARRTRASSTKSYLLKTSHPSSKWWQRKTCRSTKLLCKSWWKSPATLQLKIHHRYKLLLLAGDLDRLNKQQQRALVPVNSTKKMSKCDWSWRCQELLPKKKRLSEARTKNRKRSSRPKRKKWSDLLLKPVKLKKKGAWKLCSKRKNRFNWHHRRANSSTSTLIPVCHKMLQEQLLLNKWNPNRSNLRQPGPHPKELSPI